MDECKELLREKRRILVQKVAAETTELSQSFHCIYYVPKIRKRAKTTPYYNNNRIIADTSTH